MTHRRSLHFGLTRHTRVGIDKRSQSQTVALRRGREPEIGAGYERKPHHGHYTPGGADRTEMSDPMTARTSGFPRPSRPPTPPVRYLSNAVSDRCDGPTEALGGWINALDPACSMT